MVAPGHESAKKVQGAPPPPVQGRRPGKAFGVDAGQPEGAYQGTPRHDSAVQHSTEVLHGRKKLPFCPARAAVGGFAVVALIGYLTLYSNKKPEASALDVAKVASGTATPKNTRPGK